MNAIIFLLLFPIAILMIAFVGLWMYASSSSGKQSGWTHGKLLKLFYDPMSLFRRNEAARFLSDRETRKILNPRNKGLLIDGKNLRLNEEDSFAHTIALAPTGGGKTTRYIMPNIMKLSQQDCSMVITDPSGEIYEQTSGMLQAQGFDVQVVSPADPTRGLCYNPLARISSFNDIEEIAKTLIMSANPDYSDGTGKDSFWYQGSEDMIKVLIRCLGKAGHTEYLNLPNLLFLLQNFGGDGSPLDSFIATYADEGGRNQWKGLIGGNEKVVQSYVSTAINSLSMLNNPDTAKFMASNEVEFTSLRKRKTAFFIIVPSEKIKSYSFVLNLLYVDLFSACMKQLPNQAKQVGNPFLPVYALLDEFGHSSIPSFDTTLTTIRKYDVSISMILQSISQLESRYGKTAAETILEGGVRNRIFYPGLSTKTAGEVEKMLGKQIISESINGSERTRFENLLSADRIRVMKNDEMIFLSGNHEAMQLNTKAFYEQAAMVRRTKIGAIPRTVRQDSGRVELVGL